MLDQYQQYRDLSRYTSAPLASRRHLENFDDLEASEHSTPTPAAQMQMQTGAVTTKQEQLQPHPFTQNELSPSSWTIKEASPESNRSSRSINELLARGEPFYDSQEQHILIGVANIVLQSLFYNFEFDYEAPIISQQGEVRVQYTSIVHVDYIAETKLVCSEQEPCRCVSLDDVYLSIRCRLRAS